MPTQEYHNQAGKRIPGNTTVISTNLGWSKPGLMYWAWQQGKDGKDFRESRDAAADAGTLAHAMIEADIKGRPLPRVENPDIMSKAEAAYLNFLEWKGMVKFELLTMEVPCVSEGLQFGTTIDVLALVGENKRRSVVEVKTSNAVYEDMLIQMAAQKCAWDECHPSEPIEEFHLLKLGKEEATFSHHYFHALPLGLEAFKHLRELHDMKKKLKALIG